MPNFLEDISIEIEKTNQILDLNRELNMTIDIGDIRLQDLNHRITQSP